MTLIIEKWIYCSDCKERWKSKEQDINEGDQMIHICKFAKEQGGVE